MPKTGIVAALEREVHALVRGWRIVEKEVAGSRFRFFEKNEVIVVCGGIGAQGARRAAEALIATYAPAAIYSVGFAGALDPALKIGTVISPQRVVNAGDGSSVSLAGGERTLVSFASIASPEQKARLRQSFGAQLVDMESAAVARAAEVRGTGFGAVKVISDEFDFSFPAMERFIDSAGNFREFQFGMHAAIRPWLWAKVARLARNSKRASLALCAELRKILDANSASGDVPTTEAAKRR